MKTAKKLFAALLAVIMVMALVTVPALAEGNTGTIKITNAATGTTYRVYKIFDAAYDETSTTTTYSVTTGAVKTAAEKEDSPFSVATTAVNNAYAVALKEGKNSQDVVTWINDNFATKDGEGNITGYSLTPVSITPTTSGSTVTYADVPWGYYFITSSLGSVITVDTNTPNVEVIDKNDSNIDVTRAKTITKINGVDVTGTDANKNAKVGDTITFQVKFDGKNYITDEGKTYQVISYTVKDTPTNMTIDTTSVTVAIGNSTVTPDATGSSITATGFTLVLPWADSKTEGETTTYTSKYEDNTTIIVTYDAVVTADAITGGAKNEAKITAQHVGGDTPIVPPPTPVTVPTYSFDLVKTAPLNADGTYTVLTGAKFKLYDAATGGNVIKLVLVTDANNGNYYRPALDTDTDTVEEFAAGEVTIKGLAENTTYYLEETEAPSGYNKLEGRTAVAIEKTNLTNTAADEGTYTRGADDTGILIINNKGAELPETGGIGTTIFYVLGGVLIVGAVVILVTRKRMREE